MEESGKDGIVVVILIAVIIIAIGVFAYYNLHEKENEKSILTVSYGNENYTYTISQLKNIDEFSGKGSYKNSYGIIKDMQRYTGVKMTKLLDGIGAVSDYKIEVISKDGYSVNYTYDEINGNVTVYNSSGNETGMGGVTMILAYSEGGSYNFDDGPLRIAYVSEQGAITSSKLWAKWVVEIKISQGE